MYGNLTDINQFGSGGYGATDTHGAGLQLYFIHSEYLSPFLSGLSV